MRKIAFILLLPTLSILAASPAYFLAYDAHKEMLDNNDKIQTIEEARSAIAALASELQKLKTQQGKLGFPLDPVSKSIFERTSDEFLPDKFYDLMWKKIFFFQTFFESVDGYTTTGTITLSGTDVKLETAATTNATAELNKQPSWQGFLNFNQRSALRAALIFNQIAAQEIYIVTGNVGASDKRYGFKVSNNTLQGVTHDGSTEKTIDLQTISATTVYNLEARFRPNDQVQFLVDNEEKGVITDNLPYTDGPRTQLFTAKVKTTEAVAKSIQLSFFQYLQQRNALK